MNDPTEESALLYVLDQLDAGDRAAFEARLLREPALAALVRDLEAGFAHGIRTLPPQAPSAGLLGRIESQIDAQPAAARAPGTPRPRPVLRWVTFAQWGLAAVIAVSLATLAVQSLRRPAGPVLVYVGLDANRNTFAEVPLTGAAKDADSRFLQLATLAARFWEKPGAQPVKPESAGSRGYALFDPASQQGFIAIEQLPALAANQRYQLWLVDPATGRVSDAGILPLAGLNRGLYSFALPPADGAKSAHPNFLITVEDGGTAPTATKPRGQVVLGPPNI